MKAETAHVVIGQRVAALRASAGLLQPQLAEKMAARLGKSYNATLISRLEKGQRPLTVNELIALADIFGVSEQSLISRRGPIDIAAANWQNREQDCLHRLNVARVELQQIEGEYEFTVRMASALMHLQEYTSGGCDADTVAEALQVVSQFTDSYTASTVRPMPIRDRIDITEVLVQLGVDAETIKKAAAQSITGSQTSIVLYVLEHHDFTPDEAAE